MHVGINFFPDVTPAEKPAAVYFDECLQLVSDADRLGYHHIRVVEHYFEDAKLALELARDPINHYLRSLARAASGWITGAASAGYPGYQQPRVAGVNKV